jgi:hypothetical protein
MSPNILSAKWGLKYRMLVAKWHTFDACGTPILIRLCETGYFDGYETSSDATQWTTDTIHLHEEISVKII